MKDLFFNFEGRISRKSWWIGQLVLMAVSLALALPLFWLFGVSIDFYWNDEPSTPKTALVELIVFLVTLRPFLAIDIKRIHDRRRTAYLIVPMYLFELFMMAMDGLGKNLFTSYLDPRTQDITNLPLLIMLTIALAVMVLYFIWMIIELGFLRGTKGDNKYGPDPLADSAPSPDETF